MNEPTTIVTAGIHRHILAEGVTGREAVRIADQAARDGASVAYVGWKYSDGRTTWTYETHASAFGVTAAW